MVFAGVAHAQRSFFSVNYSVSIPTGTTSDYIDQVSGRGIKLEYQQFITTNFAVVGEIENYTLLDNNLSNNLYFGK